MVGAASRFELVGERRSLCHEAEAFLCRDIGNRVASLLNDSILLKTFSMHVGLALIDIPAINGEVKAGQWCWFECDETRTSLFDAVDAGERRIYIPGTIPLKTDRECRQSIGRLGGIGMLDFAKSAAEEIMLQVEPTALADCNHTWFYDERISTQ